MAELLLVVAILGTISTFNIQKIANSNTQLRYRAMAKEVAGTISSLLS